MRPQPAARGRQRPGGRRAKLCIAPIAFAVDLVPTKIENSVAVMSGSRMLSIVQGVDVSPQWPAVQESWNRFDHGYRNRLPPYGEHALLPHGPRALHVGHRQ